jgi:hypothetical protein
MQSTVLHLVYNWTKCLIATIDSDLPPELGLLDGWANKNLAVKHDGKSRRRTSGATREADRCESIEGGEVIYIEVECECSGSFVACVALVARGVLRELECLADREAFSFVNGRKDVLSRRVA